MSEDKWHRIAREYFTDSSGMSSFYRGLCHIIQTADPGNLQRLRKGFPELVQYVKYGVEIECPA